MLAKLPSKTYNKNLWLEISDFDSREIDFGVKRYLDQVGFIPGYLSFLISSPDFVLQHEVYREEEALPDDFCSYGGRWHFNPEWNSRPPWTKQRIKGLISCFHQEGIEVYFAVFDQVLKDRFHPEWATKHPEVLATLRTGERWDSINPLVRLKDGSLYEDFFNRKMIEVLKDYRFDGFHCADGCNHLRGQLYWSDYSDDMVGQFRETSGIKWPLSLDGAFNQDPLRLQERAEWIWRQCREEWIGFYVQRWTSHIKKQVEAVHSVGGRLVFNTSWTRDPFEAIYRWGVDYRKLAEVGVDEFVLECPGAGNDIGSEGGVIHPNYYFKILANILLTKVAIPESHLIALHHTHDVQEDYEILRHAPTFLEKEAYTYPNLFYTNDQGGISRCLEGFFVCLAADIRPDEWQMIRENWDHSFSGTPTTVSGATLICSEAAFENQLRDVIEARNATTHNLLYRLLAKGAPINSVADIGAIKNLSGPLVVLNSHQFPTDELKALSAYSNGPVVMIGKEAPPESDPVFSLEDDHASGGMMVCLFSFKLVRPLPDNEVGGDGLGEGIADSWAVEEPPIYCLDLPSRIISEPFLRSCVEVINQASGRLSNLNSESVQSTVVEMEDGVFRVFVRNNRWAYSVATVEMEGEIRSATIVTRFPYRPLEPDGRCFQVKVPPQGVVCVDVRM